MEMLSIATHGMIVAQPETLSDQGRKPLKPSQEGTLVPLVIAPLMYTPFQLVSLKILPFISGRI